MGAILRRMAIFNQGIYAHMVANYFHRQWHSVLAVEGGVGVRGGCAEARTS